MKRLKKLWIKCEKSVDRLILSCYIIKCQCDIGCNDVGDTMGDQLSWLEHLPYKQEVIGSSPISPTIDCAEIAQLVEQLTCNQQVTGSIPVFGTIFFLEGQRSGQTRQTVNLFFRVRWFKSISLHHFVLVRYILHIASQPSGKASHFDCDIRQFESSRGNHYLCSVSSAGRAFDF